MKSWSHIVTTLDNLVKEVEEITDEIRGILSEEELDRGRLDCEIDENMSEEDMEKEALHEAWKESKSR